jgi:hypothetical protein
MDHVEECPSYYVDCWGTICDCDYSHLCICDALRTCEARVHEAAYQAGKAYGLTVNGYTRGLDAARESVAEVLAYESPMGPLIRSMAALAAIDALREEEKP